MRRQVDLFVNEHFSWRTVKISEVFAMLWTASLCLLWASCVLAVPLNKPKQKLLLISFDGFRWDYDRDVDTPNLDKMAQDGVKAQYVTPPYITITSPAHFTLLTGKVFHFLQQLSQLAGDLHIMAEIVNHSEFSLGKKRKKKPQEKNELVVIECPRAQQLL